MHILTRDGILDAVQHALERMAFLLATPSETTAADALPQCEHRAIIKVSSEHGVGWLLVAVSPGFVRELASGMLGIDPAALEPSEHGAAVACELANVLAGELLTRAGGVHATVRLGLPLECAASPCRRLVEEAQTAVDGCVLVLAGELGPLVVAHRALR